MEFFLYFSLHFGYDFNYQNPLFLSNPNIQIIINSVKFSISHYCQDKNLALNWEKCHFMVIEEIVLGHKISVVRLEVDKAKVFLTETLIPPNSVKGIRSFLGHAGFYRRFIKEFLKISRPLYRQLEKDAKFEFDDSCLSAFKEIKSRLVIAPITTTPVWTLPNPRADAAYY